MIRIENIKYSHIFLNKFQIKYLQIKISNPIFLNKIFFKVIKVIFYGNFYIAI